MGRCFIFGALPVKNLIHVPSDDDYLIACDKGYDVMKSLSLVPDLVIGDFDSRGEEPDFDNVIRLNVRKNDTDVGHAVSWALEKGFTQFIIYGAVGGKLDHTFANIQIASDISVKTGERNGSVLFAGDDMSFTVIRNSAISFEKREFGRVSVFSLSERSYGVSIKGLSYEADDIELERHFPLGVSNSFIGKKSSVSVKNGELLIIWDN